MLSLRATWPVLEEMSFMGVEDDIISLWVVLLSDSEHRLIPDSLGLLVLFVNETTFSLVVLDRGLSRENRLCGKLPAGLVDIEQFLFGVELKERDFGIMSDVGMIVGDVGEGLLLLECVGLELGDVVVAS